MPVTVRTILTHRADVIYNYSLPIGQLSKNVQESRYNEFRKYREHHTRKMSKLVGLLQMKI